MPPAAGPTLGTSTSMPVSVPYTNGAPKLAKSTFGGLVIRALGAKYAGHKVQGARFKGAGRRV